jgi:hypothetical protein
MLRLTQVKESRWHDLEGFGVRLLLRPMTTAVVTAARNEALKRVAHEWEAAKAAEEDGTPMDAGMATWANPDWRAGMQDQYVAEALLRFSVEAWEGVVGEDGAPLPLSPASFQAFAAHPEASRAFLKIVLAPIEAVAAEGNGSAPSSPGAGDGGGTTAPDAAMADAQPAR